MTRRAALGLALVCIAALGEAQEAATVPPDPKVPQGANLDVPTGWVVRTDQANPKLVVGKDDRADIKFVNMTPGWHVTTGPAAILYHPASVGRGLYRASAKIHFFAPEGGHLEGYGIFFGGSDLDRPGQSYGYFLLRNDGAFLIKKRRGEATELVRDWTPSDAVAVFKPAPGADSVVNTLAVEARSDTVVFSVNGKEVAAVPRSALPVDGVVGLRINHHVNVHVADLAVTPLAAGAR
jgi:hypothetical protein